MMAAAVGPYPHRIRLRGPWECEQLIHRVTMPCRWPEAGLAGFRGSARFLRKFGYPGQIDEGEHVWLTCDGCTGVREVSLNGQLLTSTAGETFAFDVTTILTQRNRLEVLVQGDADDAGLWGEVALEIRRDAYLTDLHIQHTDAGVQVTGKVKGIAPQPLELYTLVDQQHVDYRTVQPSAEGQSFQIDLPGVTGDNKLIRIELIHVSIIWYVVELPIWQQRPQVSIPDGQGNEP
jgi:hypothetical protein